MRIKKDLKTRNEYIFAGGLWIRNFTKADAQYVNINQMVKSQDRSVIIKNDSSNRTLGLANIANERFRAPKVVIVSNGYKFEERCQFLRKLPDVVVIAINRALAKWPLMNEEPRRPINAYVVNNPYSECMSYLPKAYFPVCVASQRTKTEFLKQYKGNVFLYEPTPETNFGYSGTAPYFIDDYRNPVCAAISLAYRLGVQRIMLLCCDDSFESERPAAEQLKNGLWTYPHHKVSHDIVNAHLYWLTHQENNEVLVADYSSGPEYEQAVYIKDEEEALKFFTEDADAKNVKEN